MAWTDNLDSRYRPSLGMLEQAFPGKGAALRRLFTSSHEVMGNPAVMRWVNQCFNFPAQHELLLCALNDVLEGYGIEYVRPGRRQRDRGFAYINTGDTYNATIVRFDDGIYRVTTVGDIVEHGNYD